MQSMGQDLRYAVRALRKSPGFAAIAVATLALGIGANTAIFSIVNAVLLSPLDYADPDRIVRVLHEAPEGGFAVSRGAFSPQDFEDLRSDNAVFERIAAYDFLPGQTNSILTGDGEPDEAETAFVSADFFAVLAAVALLAGYLPSRRAARIDPISTLRGE